MSIKVLSINYVVLEIHDSVRSNSSKGYYNGDKRTPKIVQKQAMKIKKYAFPPKESNKSLNYNRNG